jgi:hypothetical protein
MAVQRFDDLAAAILARAPQVGGTRVVCVDGPAGSGKTTFAERLSRALHAPVVHMDDLYEGWDGAFSADLPARIDAWILTPLGHGLPAKYLRFDWRAHRFAEWIDVPATDVIILEGVRSADVGIRERAAIVIWVESTEALRLDRVIERDGPAIRPAMLTFQAREQEHFTTQGTRSAAHLVVRGDPEVDHAASEFIGEAGPAEGA